MVNAGIHLEAPERRRWVTPHRVVVALVLVAIIASWITALVYNQEIFFDNQGGLSVRKIDDPPRQAVPVEPELVHTEAPALAKAMDKAVETGFGAVKMEQEQAFNEAIEFLREHVDKDAGIWYVEYRGIFLMMGLEVS